MNISDHDLRQLDADSIHRLAVEQPEALELLTVRLVDDLKEAREQLNQNPHNSSRPPSSQEPWSRADTPPPKGESESESQSGTDLLEDPAEKKDADPLEDAAAPPSKRADKSPTGRKPGKQKGAPGVGRTQVLEATATQEHRPGHCACCGSELPAERAVGYSGYQEVDVQLGTEQRPGLQVKVIQHTLYETVCPVCGHETRAEPYRAPEAVGDWSGVEISAWRLIGPALAALLVWLHFELRVPVRRCRLLCHELLGLSLADGTISQALLEAGRACAPVTQQIQEEVRKATLDYADETPHFQAGEFLWLWVIASATAAFFFVDHRTKEALHQIIGDKFAGWLMSDGYRVYREHRFRLRCWAHLIRKARALAESYTPDVQGYGRTLLEIFDRLIDHVYQAREGPPEDLRPRLAKDLLELLRLCEEMTRSPNEKARKLGVEFLNDWNAIFRVLEYPEMPLTNNFAEQLLRHWVILRRISQGTRTPQGSLALATFASIISTCRLRQASPLRYLHQVIAARRQGLEAPPLPPPPQPK